MWETDSLLGEEAAASRNFPTAVEEEAAVDTVRRTAIGMGVGAGTSPDAGVGSTEVVEAAGEPESSRSVGSMLLVERAVGEELTCTNIGVVVAEVARAGAKSVRTPSPAHFQTCQATHTDLHPEAATGTSSAEGRQAAGEGTASALEAEPEGAGTGTETTKATTRTSARARAARRASYSGSLAAAEGAGASCCAGSWTRTTTLGRATWSLGRKASGEVRAVPMGM